MADVPSMAVEVQETPQLTKYGNDPKAEAAVNELVNEMVEELQRRKRLARSEFAFQAMLDSRLGGSRFDRDQQDGDEDFEQRESD